MEERFMVGNIKSNPAQNPYKVNNQSVNANRNDRRNPDFSNVDRIDISIDALRASQNAKLQEDLTKSFQQQVEE